MSQIYSLSQERLVMTVNTEPETRNPKALKTVSDYSLRQTGSTWVLLSSQGQKYVSSARSWTKRMVWQPWYIMEAVIMDFLGFSLDSSSEIKTEGLIIYEG